MSLAAGPRRLQRLDLVKQSQHHIERDQIQPKVVAQAAVFTLCTDKTVSFDAFLARHGLESALTKFTIPQEEAGRFRDQLDTAGIDERRLFPDLDGLAAQLGRYYS